MKKFLFLAISISFLFLLSPSIGVKVYAAFLDFDQSTVSINAGESFDIQVTIDAGSDQVSSNDAYVIYDPTLLEAQSVTPGDYFPTVVNNITSGRLYVAGLVDDPATYKTGTGTIATISFRALTDGIGTLTYDCQEGVYNSSKIIKNDLNATNVIDCSLNGSSSVTVGAGISTGSTGSTDSTATPSALPQSGLFENVSKIAVPGMILLLIGGALRLVL